MGVIGRGLSIATLVLTALSSAGIAVAAPEDAAARNARWNQLQQAIFKGRPVLDGAGVLELEAPQRALDAALVPLTVTMTGKPAIRSLYIVIDNNPSPLAGRFTFGSAADPRILKVRMRVDQYTDIRAVGESEDGKLYAVSKFVKAAGGCSAPAGADDAEALKDLGRMKVRLLDEYSIGKPMQAQLMVRHPNFNGMQMNQITRYYTPAHFIRSIDVTYAGENVLRVESDITLSTDPVITFGFIPRKKGALSVLVQDSKDLRFERAFDVPTAVEVASETRGGA